VNVASMIRRLKEWLPAPSQLRNANCSRYHHERQNLGNTLCDRTFLGCLGYARPGIV
jgi:hypothetical protein